MQLKVEEALRVFKKLDMSIREGRDTLAFLFYENKLILQTKISHKRGDAGGNIPYFIRQQLKLNENQFMKLKSCTMTRDKYIEILKEKGIL